MEACCTIVVIILVVVVLGFIISAANDAAKKREKEREQQYNRNRSDCTSKINEIKHLYAQAESAERRAMDALNSLFDISVIDTRILIVNNRRADDDDDSEIIRLTPAYSSYQGVQQTLNTVISEMQAHASEMGRKNRTLRDMPDSSPVDDQNGLINKINDEMLPKLRRYETALTDLIGKSDTVLTSYMIDENGYGKFDRAYWDAVTAIGHGEAVQFINDCSVHFTNKDYVAICSIDIAKVLRCVWCFALEKTFSAPDFQEATKVFSRMYKAPHADIIIADLYARKKMGGESVLNDPIRRIVKKLVDVDTMTLVASGLMWMNAYQTEHTVLQHMLLHGMEMTAKAQERLHSLTNGGGKAPTAFEVESASELYFDVSALAWRDEEYSGFFENLAFQDKILTYSLAIRDEDKNLFITQGIGMPSNSDVLSKIKAGFADEYGLTVDARISHSIALSGSGEEKINGILATTDECRQLGILIHIAAIGKKLIIKFYTLFMPVSDELGIQKQQALSMFKKLSPSVVMWESSLKDTMLMAVQQLLNTANQSKPTEQPTVPHADEEKPVF